LDHEVNLNKVSADLLHEVLLGHNADKDFERTSENDLCGEKKCE
jgi:hypothetical protein